MTLQQLASLHMCLLLPITLTLPIQILPHHMPLPLDRLLPAKLRRELIPAQRLYLLYNIDPPLPPVMHVGVWILDELVEVAVLDCDGFLEYEDFVEGLHEVAVLCGDYQGFVWDLLLEDVQD